MEVGKRHSQQEHKIDDSTLDLVIMNPPYTRPVTHEAALEGVPVPAFAALGTEADEQRAMGKLLSKIGGGTPYHGSAGLASAFLALADRKLQTGGKLALVFPQSFLAGKSWEKGRELLCNKFSDVIVVTTGDAKDKSFSADTGMGECLLLADKRPNNQGRGRFVTLLKRPRNEMDGVSIAHAIQSLTFVRRLEDGPFGGTTIKVGDDEIGTVA